MKNYAAQLSRYREELQAVANEKARERLDSEKKEKEKLAKKPVLVKTPSVRPNTSSSQGEESDDEDDEEFNAMQLRALRARKENSMAQAMREVNTKGKAKLKDGWSKYNIRAVSREDAELALRAAQLGSWLVRDANNGKPVVSYLKDGKPSHDIIEKSIAKGGGPQEKNLNPALAIRSTTVLRRLVTAGAFQAAVAQVKALPGFLTDLDATGAEAKLQNAAVGAWLVRESAKQTGVVTWTQRVAEGMAPKSFVHTRILKLSDQQAFMNYARTNRRLQVRA